MLKYFSLDLDQYGIQRPELGPEAERARLQQTDSGRITTAAPRMPTLDVGLAPLLANVRSLDERIHCSVTGAVAGCCADVVEVELFAGSSNRETRACQSDQSRWTTARNRKQWFAAL